MLAKELHARERALHAASCDRVGQLLIADFMDIDVANMSRDIASGVYKYLLISLYYTFDSKYY